MPTEFDAWFVREVLVHERALALFLQRHWPHRDEWHDLRQEVYGRGYEAAGRVGRVADVDARRQPTVGERPAE